MQIGLQKDRGRQTTIQKQPGNVEADLLHSIYSILALVIFFSALFSADLKKSVTKKTPCAPVKACMPVHLGTALPS